MSYVEPLFTPKAFVSAEPRRVSVSPRLCLGSPACCTHMSTGKAFEKLLNRQPFWVLALLSTYENLSNRQPDFRESIKQIPPEQICYTFRSKRVVFCHDITSTFV
ncbi:hypothetical protein PGT21_007055 [Puccinia graminis f. sp. tritici]|uniref:Uncharacterized protein n=1 Tax=Puccinia graminis f. sp. tritici TaxID=56615 RepID=A0A5B0SIE5_PUCGR|nr:hypothetical protein PGT21_007055 [Puccinia graminis f. sp. tritici]KAA1137728.1 hypothetical protein PGTUg99_008139 [Puccinia graminis f. sp. tritici]